MAEKNKETEKAFMDELESVIGSFESVKFHLLIRRIRQSVDIDLCARGYAWNIKSVISHNPNLMRRFLESVPLPRSVAAILSNPDYDYKDDRGDSEFWGVGGERCITDAERADRRKRGMTTSRADAISGKRTIMQAEWGQVVWTDAVILPDLSKVFTKDNPELPSCSGSKVTDACSGSKVYQVPRPSESSSSTVSRTLASGCGVGDSTECAGASFELTSEMDLGDDDVEYDGSEFSGSYYGLSSDEHQETFGHSDDSCESKKDEHDSESGEKNLREIECDNSKGGKSDDQTFSSCSESESTGEHSKESSKSVKVYDSDEDVLNEAALDEDVCEIQAFINMIDEISDDEFMSD